MDIHCNLLWILEGIILLKRHIQVYLQRRDNDKVLSLFLAIGLFAVIRELFLLGDQYGRKGVLGIQMMIFILSRYWFQKLEEKIMGCNVVRKMRERIGTVKYLKQVRRGNRVNKGGFMILKNEIQILILSIMDFVFTILILETVPIRCVNEYVEYLTRYIIFQ